MALDTFELSVLMWGGALLAGALCGKIAPARRTWYPYVAAGVFLLVAIFCAQATRRAADLPAEVAPIRYLWSAGLLGGAVLLLYGTRRSRLALPTLFALLFGVDILDRLGLSLAGVEILRPLGFSYFAFRLYDALQSGPAQSPADWRRIVVQSAAPPALAAGPIVLSGQHHTLPGPLRLDRPTFRRALLLFALGVIKLKLLLPALQSAFETGLALPAELTAEYALAVWRAGLYHYARLYLDFSGYTDIAVSACALLGLKIRHNFLRPYFAVTLADFWRRWHITLGAFLRRHVYLPHGGRRRSGAVWLVFALLGLWHGVTLTFLTWGLLHAAYFLLERHALTPARAALASRWPVCARPATWLQYALTQTFVTCSWVLFFMGVAQ